MKRREVKRSFEFQNYSSESAAKPRLRSHSGAIRKGVWPRRLLKALPYVLVLSLIFYLIFISSIFQVGNIAVQGPNSTLSQQLEKETTDYLNARLFGKNWLLINESDLKKYLQGTFTGQETITIKKTFPNKLSVSTDEQKPALLWKTGSRLYVLSPNGYAISETNKEQSAKAEEAKLATVYDSTNLPVQIGGKVVGRNFVTFAAKLNDFMKSNNLGPNQIYVKDTTAELIVTTNAGYEIKLTAALDVDSQLRSLQATLDLLAQQGKKPASYIDLRVPGRAFYK